MNKKNGTLFYIIAAFIVAVSLLNAVLPDKTYSENENKYLATMPKITFKNLVNGTFATRYESYISDQFLLRDQWISAKSVSEFLLMKTENNGVAYGEDGYMFVKSADLNETVAERNLTAISTFAENAKSDVYVMVVPSASLPLADKVPAGLPTVNEDLVIDKIYESLAPVATAVNAKDALSANAEEYIYYRTDHHWTTFGAWLGYNQFAQAAGFTPFGYHSETPVQVENFLGTSYSKCKAFNAKADVLEYFPTLNGTIKLGEDKVFDSIYNLEKLETRDKYAAFLHGNNGYTEITTEQSASKRDSILIIRDSYADSLTPFLTENYNKIVLVDPRYYNGSFAELGQQPFSDILILYGFDNITGETSIAKLGFTEE